MTYIPSETFPVAPFLPADEWWEKELAASRASAKALLATGKPPAAPVLSTTQPHYTTLKPEPIDVIEGWGFDKNFYRANAIKYIARAGRKDASKEGTIKDLEKAISYLRREINALNGNPSW